MGPVHLIATGGTVGSFALTTSDLQDLVADARRCPGEGPDGIVVTQDTDRPGRGQARREGARRR